MVNWYKGNIHRTMKQTFNKNVLAIKIDKQG